MSLEFNTLVKRIFFNWHVKILSVTAAVLLFVFNRMINLDENTLAVPLVLKLGEDMTISTPLSSDTIDVTIRGDKDLEIGKIAANDIEVYADLSHFTTDGTYAIKLQYEKKGLAASLTPVSLALEPQEMKISIERILAKSVPIDASIVAGPPDDFDFSYSIVPTHTVISGPRSKVEIVERVTTEGIDLSGKTENFSIPVKLVTPDSLIRFRESGQVEFYCIINQVIVEKTVEARIRTVNLNAKLNPESRIPLIGSLVLKISPQLLDTIVSDDISLILDCSSIKGSGRYTIRTKPMVPEGIVVVRYSPEEITLDVSGL
jgi:YbbR domain-containing protein